MDPLRTAGLPSLLLLLAACGSSGSSPGGSPEGGGTGSDTGALGHDTGTMDATMHRHDGGAPDTGTHHDAGASDAKDSGSSTRDGSSSDAEQVGDACVADACVHKKCTVDLAWNEGCSQSVLSFDVLWGRTDGGPYPDKLDAGYPCDAAACSAGGSNPQLACSYKVKGLEGGTWCFVTEACNDAGCSVPSGQACGTVSAGCP